MTKEFDQAKIYDARYSGSNYYGTTSPVPVLTAEREALAGAIDRQQSSNNADEVSMLDIGYGTGRIPNEVLLLWNGPKGLTLVAYDLAIEGLKRGIAGLLETGQFRRSTTRKHELEVLESTDLSAPKKLVSFILAHEGANDADLLFDVNNGSPYDITTSWYGVVGHESDPKKRMELFRLLGKVTCESGEIVVTTSAIGDFNREHGSEGFRDLPCKGDGRNVIYETEAPGVEEYIHLYGEDFEQNMEATRTAMGQKIWLEPIRLPGPEYMTPEDELRAHGELVRFRNEHNHYPWKHNEYAAVHTVGGFRSSQTRP